jgi:hypothetical protein
VKQNRKNKHAKQKDKEKQERRHRTMRIELKKMSTTTNRVLRKTFATTLLRTENQDPIK